MKVVVSNKYQTMMAETAGVPGVTTVSPWPSNLSEAFDVLKASTAASEWACDYYGAGDVTTSVTVPLFKQLLFGQIEPEEFITQMVDQQAAFYNK